MSEFAYEGDKLPGPPPGAIPPHLSQCHEIVSCPPEITQVPEPATWMLFAIAAITGLIVRRLRK
jgi:hypothetical protein